MVADPEPPTLDELRPRLAEAILAHVPFDGWTATALAAAERDLGLVPGTGQLALPGGAVDMIDAWIARADALMAAALDTDDFRALKVREKIATAILTRLEQARPHREALRRATAVLALPGNAPRALALSWRTADGIWRLAGDRATDFNHYSKRALVAAVYASTLLIWLDDEDEGMERTRAFLARRIDQVMAIERARARLKPSGERLSIARFLGRLRYPVE